MNRLPRMVFETYKHPYVACVTSSLLMAFDLWTDGESWKYVPEYPNYLPVVGRLRAGIPADQGTSPGPSRTAFGKEFPMFPLLNADFFTPLQTVAMLVGMGYVFVMIGNPSKCRAASPLRRWQGGTDNYDHAILLTEIQGDLGWIMDPLSPVGSYRGQWVPLEDIRQYAARFQNDSGVECIMFERGGALKGLEMGIDYSETTDLVVPKGTPYYESARTTSKIITRESQDNKPREYGVAMGGGGWLQVKVETAAPAGKLGTYGLWVDPKTPNIQRVPKVVTPPVVPPDVEALTKERDEAVAAAKAAGEKLSEKVEAIVAVTLTANELVTALEEANK